MIIVRIITSLILFSLGFWITKINISPLFSNSLLITTSGPINIWAGIACFMWGGYGLIYYIFYSYKRNHPIFDFNKVTIIIGTIISPLLAMIIIYNININIIGYTECKNLRELSSRYSSRTYAKSIELCQQEQ
ncbi:hypothetical protein [Vibrio sp. TRT 1302]|uniref:hypothetical protein n=1 Tax=Vibrio sp. TRT 1302 TaxID=3418504 RepID=UPI003CEA65E2